MRYTLTSYTQYNGALNLLDSDDLSLLTNIANELAHNNQRIIVKNNKTGKSVYIAERRQ